MDTASLYSAGGTPLQSTWVDPDTDVTAGAETGREPLAKTASYYKRSWTSGVPYSSVPQTKSVL